MRVESLEVTPGPPARDLPNGAGLDAILSSEPYAIAMSTTYIARSDIPNVRLRQLRRRMPFAVRVSAFTDCILRVVQSRAKEQMSRVTAGRIVAAVTDFAFSAWQWAMRYNPCHSAGVNTFVVEQQVAISILAIGASKGPTGVSAGRLVHLAPQAFSHWLSFSREHALRHVVLILLLTEFVACQKRTEVKTDAHETETVAGTTHATATDEDKQASWGRDVLRTGPIETDITTTVETFASDGGLVKRTTRKAHQKADPSSEVKEAATAEDDTKQMQRQAELNEVREKLAKTDKVETSKPSLGIGVRIILLVAALAVVAVAVFRKYLAARFGWLSWLVRK